MRAMCQKSEDGSPAANPVRGFHSFGDDARWFRGLLGSKGVTVMGGSPMDRALEAMTRGSRYVQHPPKNPAVGVRAAQLLETEAFRNQMKQLLLDAIAGANLVRMVRKALSVSPTVFDDHLHRFRGPDVFVGKEGKGRDRDLAWEFFIAAVAVCAADAVKIGKPDVRCRIRNVSWGIECKVFTSLKPEKHVERVKEAVRQLEASSVTRGFIAVNVTNVVDHTHLDEAILSFGKDRLTQDQVLGDLGQQVATIASPFKQAQFLDWLGSHPKTRALFFQANTTALVGFSVPFLTAQLWLAFGQRNPADEAMANRFQRAAESL